MTRILSASSAKFVLLSIWLLSLPVPVAAQPGNLLGGSGLRLGGDSISLEPTVSVRFEPATAMPGDIVSLEVQVQISESAYVYSQNPNVGAETRIEIAEHPGLEAVDSKFTPNREPKVEIEPVFDNARLEKFYGGVTWSRKFRVTAETAKVQGTLVFQVCDETTCNPVRQEIEVSLAAGGQPAKTPRLRMLLQESETADPAQKPASTAAVSGTILAQQTLNPKRQYSKEPDPITLDIQLVRTPETGDEPVFALVIAARVEEPWHIYALNHDPAMMALPTVLKVDDIPGLIPLEEEFTPDHEPEVSQPLPDVTQLVHHHEVKWQKRFRFDQQRFQGLVTGSIRYQLCENGSCLAPYTVKFQVGKATEGSAVAGAPAAGAAVAPVSASGDRTATGASAAPVEEPLSPEQRGLIPFLITGIIFGYLALLTPCVFPMIPITISFFLKQAEKENHNAVWMAGLYCLGIVATFTIIGIAVSAVFGVSQMNQLANNVWLNLFLAAVLIFFGVSMLGMFEIRVPSWLLTWSSSHERSGGLLGVLFMSFTFTLVSFTCTFAFVGLLLPMAARGEYYWPTLGMIAFSTAFASPFFFLALFPSFLKKLPKSGGWMNMVKVVFGLLEIGAAVKFLSVADIGFFSVPFLFDYTLVMIIWIVLSALAGLYLVGLYHMPSDTPSSHISVVQLGLATMFFCLAAYLASGIYAPQKPDGFLWQQIAAFAPPRYHTQEDIDLGPTVEHDRLLYAMDVDQAIKYAQAQNEPLFFDFTGTNCVNCRFMEINVFPKEPNRGLLENFVRVQLYTDVIPGITDTQLQEKLLDRNRYLQSEWFRNATLPAYAVVTPDGQTILSSLMGKASQEDFTRFLQAGLNEWQRTKTAMEANPTRR